MKTHVSRVQKIALDFAIAMVLRSPVKNFPKLVNWAEKFDKGKEYAHIIRGIRPVASDPRNVWNQYIINLCKDVDHRVLKRVMHNFAVNASFAGKNRQEACKKNMGAIYPGRY